MQTFIHHREDYLKLSMILKGRGDHVPPSCSTCPSDQMPEEPTFRCLDCQQGLTCQDCCVSQHQFNPLHRIQVHKLLKMLQSFLAETFEKAVEWPIFSANFPTSSWTCHTTRSSGSFQMHKSNSRSFQVCGHPHKWHPSGLPKLLWVCCFNLDNGFNTTSEMGAAYALSVVSRYSRPSKNCLHIPNA
jgi:hypothetical protein